MRYLKPFSRESEPRSGRCEARSIRGDNRHSGAWRAVSGRRQSGGRQSPMTDYADAAAYVLIAEPGAGKTTAFETEAARQGAVCIIPHAVLDPNEGRIVRQATPMLRTDAFTSPGVAWSVGWGAVPGSPKWARAASHQSGASHAYLGNPPPRLHQAVAAVPHPRQPAQIRLDKAALPPALGRHPRRRRASRRARALPRTHHVCRRRRSPQRPLGALYGL